MERIKALRYLQLGPLPADRVMRRPLSKKQNGNRAVRRRSLGTINEPAPSEGCAVRSLQADGWHIDLLRSCKLVFPDDALVPVGLAFDAVLECVPCFGEQANDFEEPSFCCVFLIPIRRKLHCLANRKFMGGHSYLSA